MQNQGQSGQALIESCLMVALICLILAGLFQLSQLYSAKEITAYACARGAGISFIKNTDAFIPRGKPRGTLRLFVRIHAKPSTKLPIRKNAIKKMKVVSPDLCS